MTNLTASPSWDSVWQWDSSTPLLGGAPNDPMNRQAQALLNRIEYMYENKNLFAGNLSTSKVGSSFFEFQNQNPGNGNVKISVGALGNPEANLSVNMDYTTGVHKFYDTDYGAMWFALSPGTGPTTGGWAIQFAAAGTPSSGDVWNDSGNKYLVQGDAHGRLRVNTSAGDAYGDAQLYVNRGGAWASIGGNTDLVIEGTRIFGNAAPIILNGYSAGKVGIGNPNPLNRLDISIASAAGTSGGDGVSINDGDPTSRVSLALGINTSATYGWLQASKGGVGFKPLAIQPNGGGAVVGSATAVPSAALAVDSTTSGFRLPKMTTTQKNAIASPDGGLMVFDTTLRKACLYTGAAWETMTSV